MLELRCAENTSSESQLEAHLQVIPVELFPENHDIVVKSVRQVAAKGLQQYCNMPAQTLGLKLT
jgi:hypothetical protein